MASAVDSRLAYARLSAVATASRLPTATRGSNNSYTTSWDTTFVAGNYFEDSCIEGCLQPGAYVAVTVNSLLNSSHIDGNPAMAHRPTT